MTTTETTQLTDLEKRLLEVTHQVENLLGDMIDDLAIQGLDKPTFAINCVDAAYIELLAAHFPDEKNSLVEQKEPKQ